MLISNADKLYEYVEDKIIEDNKYYLLFDEYMIWGGFPIVCKKEEMESREVLLSNIYDSVVLKDIIMRNKVASPVVLEKVLEYIVANSSLTVSGNNIANILSNDTDSVSAPTVYDYIRYMTEACICDKVSRYDIRGKKILAYGEKMYVCDMGFFHLKKNRVLSVNSFNVIVSFWLS